MQRRRALPDLCHDVGTPVQRMAQFLEDQHRGALPQDKAVAVPVKWAARLGRPVVEPFYEWREGTVSRGGRMGP